MFRRKIFGGFNKADVEEYIKALEDELEKSKEGRASLSEQDKSIIDESIEEIVKLKNEREVLENKLEELQNELKKKESETGFNNTDSENAELLVKLFTENKRLKEEIKNNELTEGQQKQDRDAIKQVLAEAKEKARILLLNTEKISEYRKKRAEEKLKDELENKVIEFVTINYRLAEFVKEVDNISEQLKQISQSLQNVSTEVPAKVMDLLDEEDKNIINSSGNILVENESGSKDNVERAEFGL